MLIKFAEDTKRDVTVNTLDDKIGTDFDKLEKYVENNWMMLNGDKNKDAFKKN